MGGPVPPTPEPRKGSFTMDCSCAEMRSSSWVMALQYRLTGWIIRRVSGVRDPADPGLRMMLADAVNCPMRSLVINTGGRVDEALARGLLEMANGHFFRGLGMILRRRR